MDDANVTLTVNDPNYTISPRSVTSSDHPRKKSSATVDDILTTKQKMGYGTLLLWSVWLAFLFSALVEQNRVTTAFETSAGVDQVFLREFTDTDKTVDITFDQISTRRQWYDWMEQVAVAAVYDISNLNNLLDIERTFTCVEDGTTILKFQRCDGVSDCSDESDEAGCYVTDTRISILPNTNLDFDFGLNVTENPGTGDVTYNCVDGVISFTPINDATAYVVSVPYSRVDYVEAIINEGLELQQDVTPRPQDTIIIETTLGQYYKIGRGPDASCVPNTPLNIIWSPLQEPCFTDEFSCRANANETQLSAYGARLGRCLPKCMLCDTSADCLLLDDSEDDVQSPEEQLTECGECGPFVETFANPHFVLAAFPILSQARRSTGICPDGQFDKWWQTCTGDVISDPNTVLCAGYCTDVDTVWNEAENETEYIAQCNSGTVQTSTLSTAVLDSGADSDDEEEEGRRSQCEYFTISSAFGDVSLTGSTFVSVIDDACAAPARDALAFLESANFLDEETAAVKMSYILFNPNENALMLAEYAILMQATGWVEPEHSVFTIFLDPYDTSRSEIAFRVAMEIIVVVVFVIFVFNELRSLWRQKLEYFHNMWNLMDWTFIVLFVVMVGVWLDYVSAVYDIQTPCNSYSFEQSQNLVFSTITASDKISTYRLWMVFFMFAVIMETFRVLSFQAYLQLLIITVRDSAALLVSLIILVVYTFACFAVLAHLAFGSRNQDYASVSTIVPTLFAMMVGEVDYKGMSEANQQVAPIFLVAYLILVTLVILNLVIAIVINSFDQDAADMDDRRSIFGEIKIMFVSAYRAVRGRPMPQRRKKRHNHNNDHVEMVQQGPSPEVRQLMTEVAEMKQMLRTMMQQGQPQM